MKVSAIIPTFNEEVNIKYAIDSVLWADEIIVVDSFSTDKTLEIARSYEKVKILEHEYINSAAQKNWTIPQATHEWIFLLDADEVATEELKLEIQNTLREGPKYSAYWIGRKNIFMNKILRFVWKNDAVIRLFKRDECRYEDKQVHAEIISQGSIGRLSAKILHDTYKGKGLISHIKKGDRYTTWAAHDYAKKVKKVSYSHLLIRPFLIFLKHYIFKGGIFDGKQGLIISALSSWNVFIRFVKVWRIHEGEDIKRE